MPVAASRRALETLRRATPDRAVSKTRTARARPTPQWSRLSDEKLLQLRFCDLGLRIEGTRVARGLKQLYSELAARGVPFEPHAWLADEWFSPDGVPGIAVPFYLAHPRLERLQRHMERETEGGNSRLLMRILRHEAGHAIDTAYRLRRRRRWRETFGSPSLPYPDRYRARPGSRRYVHHLGDWYAQSHPTEDFAETFAVWLTPRSSWRSSYADWPALNKLTVVQDFMTEVGGRRAPVRNRLRIESIETNTMTLAEHYRRRMVRRRWHQRGTADTLLRKAFTATRPRPKAPRAASFLRAHQATLVAAVARSEDADAYTVQQHLRVMITRCGYQGLYLRGNRRIAQRHARAILTRLTRLYSGIESPVLKL